MAKIHVLQGQGANRYSVVVHAPTPAGNNTAGVSFATAINNSLIQAAGSVMPVGNAAGQITTNENNQVTNGTVIEAQFAWDDDPNWTNAQRQNDLDIRAQQRIDELIAEYGVRFKLFGFTRT